MKSDNQIIQGVDEMTDRIIGFFLTALGISLIVIFSSWQVALGACFILLSHEIKAH